MPAIKFSEFPQAVDEILRERGVKMPEERKLNWRALPRQLEAMQSDAFETLYGGAAGGGKTDLQLGCARLEHKSCVIFRRTTPQLRDSVVERGLELYSDTRRYNTQALTWRFGDGCIVRFRHLQHLKDIHSHQSAQYDYIGFDELTQFLEAQYTYMISRCRTARGGQRCRIVATTNPGGEGNDWVMTRWGPWLDEDHPNPAAPGELRWFARLGGKDTEVPGPDPIRDAAGETIYPTSRTFIPARLTDNPYLPPAYTSYLQTLPEPFRSQLLNGDWQAGLTDDAYQVIPTAWIKTAQKRWTEEGARAPLDAVGLDVAMGGEDWAVAADRRGDWIGPLRAMPGYQAREARDLLPLFEPTLLANPGAVLNFDGIGIGQGIHAITTERKLRAQAVIFSEASGHHATGNPTLKFLNRRAECWWRLRELLDPELGARLALPLDPELVADLKAPRWEMRPGGLKIEAKEDIRERTGRSPDRAEAVVYACWRFEPPGTRTYAMLDPKLHRQVLRPIIRADRQHRAVYHLDLEGFPPGHFERKGRLVRAMWISAVAGHACLWAHIDTDGAICVVDALESKRTLEEFAGEAVWRSAWDPVSGKGADVVHRYEWDLVSADDEDEEFLDTLHNAMQSAAQRMGRKARDTELPEWLPEEEIAGQRGIEAIRRLLVAKLADLPDHPYWQGDRTAAARHSVRERLYLWPKEALARLADSHYIEAGDDVSAVAGLKGGAVIESGIVRCLRILAVKGVGLRF